MSRAQKAQKGRENRRYRLKGPHRCWRLGSHMGCRGACREREKKCLNTDMNCGAGEDSWVHWTARRSNQSILKEINPEYSLEGLMLNLKLQYFGHMMQRADNWRSPWCWEKLRTEGEEGVRLRTEGEEGVRGWDGWMATHLQWTWTWANFRRWWGTERPGVLQSMGSQRVGYDWKTEWQQWMRSTWKSKINRHFRTERAGDFSHDSVAETPCSQCRGPGFDPWSGNWMPHASTKSPHATMADPTCHSLKILHATTKTEDPTCCN